MKCIGKKRVLIYMMSIVWAVLLAGCGMNPSQKMTYTDTAMGTVVQQTLYIGDKTNQTEDVQAGDGQAGDPQAEDPQVIPSDLMALLDSLEKKPYPGGKKLQKYPGSIQQRKMPAVRSRRKCSSTWKSSVMYGWRAAVPWM